MTANYEQKTDTYNKSEIAKQLRPQLVELATTCLRNKAYIDNLLANHRNKTQMKDEFTFELHATTPP
ncbi:MAG: hypothetical protein ACKPKO_55640 [Candidatus Fonsibacter sp.]